MVTHGDVGHKLFVIRLEGAKFVHQPPCHSHSEDFFMKQLKIYGNIFYTKAPLVRVFGFFLLCSEDDFRLYYAIRGPCSKVKAEIDCMQSNRESGCVAATAFLNAFCSCSIAVYVTPS